MKKAIKVLGFLLLSVVMAFTGRLSVYADDETTKNGLVLGPSSQRITLKPGNSYRSSIKVSSPADSSSESKYVIYVAPYSVSNSDYDPIFDENNEYTQIVKWISLDKEEGVIAPNHQEDIGFTIDVPLDAPAGGQYATIMLQDITGLEEEKNQAGSISISNITAIGSILVADVEGNTRKDGEIINNELPGFLLNKTLEATSLVKNNGNIHADAKYILQVWPLFSNEELCTNEENEDGEFVFPGTEKYHVQSCELPAVGIFRAKQTVTIFDEESIVEKIVIICPIWLLFIIISAVFALIFYFVAKAKARKKANQKASRS